MGAARVLFVDDEPNIRLTLPPILHMHGFQVTAAATVAEALKEIQEQSFDVLIADLNIGQAGDGFTIVSAMRRTQPSAITIILTGYPAFESALEAIRNQVDDYAVKPARVEDLISIIRQKLEHREPRRPLPVRSLAAILRENHTTILNSWIAAASQSNSETTSVAVQERSSFLARILLDLRQCLSGGHAAGSGDSRLADLRFAHQLRSHGYSVSMLLKETSLLRHVMLQAVQAHLLSLDMSSVFTDLATLDDCLDLHLRHIVESFLGEDVLAA